jgi:putative SOS response-associated peptidase YedK
MPVIIRQEAWLAWLKASVEEVSNLVLPYEADEMRARPVSRQVSRLSTLTQALSSRFNHDLLQEEVRGI